jgi:hypothetical protein
MKRAILILGFLGLFSAGCDDGSGIGEAPGVDAGSDVGGADSCHSPVVLAPMNGDPCSFSLSASSVGHRVDLYVGGQHQAASAYAVAGDALTITSTFVCTARVRSGDVGMLPVDVLVDCASPPASM